MLRFIATDNNHDVQMIPIRFNNEHLSNVPQMIGYYCQGQDNITI